MVLVVSFCRGLFSQMQAQKDAEYQRNRTRVAEVNQFVARQRADMQARRARGEAAVKEEHEED